MENGENSSGFNSVYSHIDRLNRKVDETRLEILGKIEVLSDKHQQTDRYFDRQFSLLTTQLSVLETKMRIGQWLSGVVCTILIGAVISLLWSSALEQKRQVIETMPQRKSSNNNVQHSAHFLVVLP